jgi:Xaa-Pro dipeptidase
MRLMKRVEQLAGYGMGAAFSESEHRERLRKISEAARQEGLDGCVCVAPEHLYYICGYDNFTGGTSEQALIFTTGNDEPTLIIRDVDLPLAHETSWLKDIRTYHVGARDPAENIAQVAKEKGLLGKSVGLDLRSFAVPGAYALRLIRALGTTKVEDSTPLVRKARWIKSPRELEYVREAAQYARIGLDTLSKTKPGMTEFELAAKIEYAMRSRGSETPSLPTFVASGPRSPGGHGMATKRVLQKGDIIHVEFAGVARRYHCVSMKTYFLGAPSRRARDVYEATRESMLAGLAAVRLGTPVSAAAEACQKSLESSGLAKYAPMRFGLGIGASYSMTWNDGLFIIREVSDVFQPNMVFYVHSWIQLEEEGLGFLIGGSYLLTQKGLEALDGGNSELTEL